MISCLNCGKMNISMNYCDWECMIESARKGGGREILPNGLPVRCILADGTMLECAHGDHPDYKFPVLVMSGESRPEDIAIGVGCPEMHALLYTDGTVALTIHDALYWLWSLFTGKLISGPPWASDYYLTSGTIELIKESINGCEQE